MQVSKMQVFASQQHRLHAPQWYVADGTVRPCPDDPARVERILRALQDAGYRISMIEADPLKSRPGVPGQESKIALPDPWPAIRRIHTADYLHYLQTIHTLWTAEFGKDVDVIPDTFPRFGRALPQTRPAKPAAQAGYYCFDMAAPITAGTWAAVLASATCAASAAEAVVRGDRAAYALCRPPGHHAGADYCGGFCYLNNAAIAAQHLLLAGKKRVAVLDIDYHHGNGTQDIFYARNDVLFVSLHAEPDTQYPYFWGHSGETGTGAGAGCNRNFPLPRGTREPQWLETLSSAITCVADFAPEALVLSLGVDAYEKDTVGDFGVTLQGYAAAGRALRQLNLPTAIIQEGGYNLDAVGPCVAAFLQAMAE